MKSLPLSQAEMLHSSNSGETIVVAYRNAYEIQYSRGTECFHLSPMPKKVSGLPYTQRGRFHCVTPEHFRKIQLA
jgi:hypothetical protein